MPDLSDESYSPPSSAAAIHIVLPGSIVDHVHLATRVLAYEQARREVEDRLRFAGTEPSNVGSAALHAMVNQHLNENRSRLVVLIEARFEPFLAELREALVRPIVMAHFRDE